MCTQTRKLIFRNCLPDCDTEYYKTFCLDCCMPSLLMPGRHCFKILTFSILIIFIITTHSRILKLLGKFVFFTLNKNIINDSNCVVICYYYNCHLFSSFSMATEKTPVIRFLFNRHGTNVTTV